MEELPLGYRFYPTEEELVSFYLHNKLQGNREELNRIMDRIIPVLDIYILNPWELPQFSGPMCHGDTEQWFFFIPRQEREARGGRPNRLTDSGYWKATGSPGYVYSSDNRHIGLKRTMVFYKGRAPTGTKTHWKMNEYRAFQGDSTPSTSTPPKLMLAFSLCRVYIKSKCFRAFDRRPSRTVVTTQQAEALQTRDVICVDEATMLPQNDTPLNNKIPSSPESSSSGELGNQHPPEIGASSSINWEICADNDIVWDWEPMNLY